ncbi:endonuclease [Nitrincola sp.]|uniref:endonuclease n=1 Tax=Nitrincola sp. TaxID=1926584 RepID=UPI003A913AF6
MCSRVLVVALLLVQMLISLDPVSARQMQIKNYDQAREEYFWIELYPNGHEGIYCGTVLTGGGPESSIEHAFPADWIADNFGCADRNSCDVADYFWAEADLHNLWPANRRINSSRGKLPFGVIPDSLNARRFEQLCEDYERSTGSAAVVEPVDKSKGALARSILYMSSEYFLIPKGDVQTLIEWALQYPPSEHEKWRNEEIERIQGTRNKFIDDPSSVGDFVVPDN